MKRITNVTKRQIKELFNNGVDLGMFEPHYQRYLYWGSCKNELSFLKRLYPLEKMPSSDSRYKNAEGDIIQHTINNDDWELCWVFEDDRFPLQNGTDEDYLRFLIEIFNPEVCIEGEVMNRYFSRIQGLLHEDGYELYASDYVSGKPTYSWRFLTAKEIKTTKYLPFSVRYENELKTKKIVLPSIRKLDRRRLLDLMGKYEETCYLTTETGWNYTKLTKDAMWDDIKEYYSPKAFNSENKYDGTDSLEDFIMSNYPQYVFDTVELYNRLTSESLFEMEVNSTIGKYGYKLVYGKIQLMELFQTCIEMPQDDTDLKILVQQSQVFISEKNSDGLQLALEKIWDAFERVKTEYNDKDKKRSLLELEKKISGGSKEIVEFMNAEFAFLTKLGNEYQIRHFERNKKSFPSEEIKTYFYNRCASLVNLCICHLNDLSQ